MDALFVNLFVIILILILQAYCKSTILYADKRDERRSANPKGDYLMNRNLDSFFFYFPRIAMAIIGAIAFIFAAWFCQFYYIYLNCIVLPIACVLGACGFDCACQVIRAYRYSL